MREREVVLFPLYSNLKYFGLFCFPSKCNCTENHGSICFTWEHSASDECNVFCCTLIFAFDYRTFFQFILLRNIRLNLSQTIPNFLTYCPFKRDKIKALCWIWPSCVWWHKWKQRRSLTLKLRPPEEFSCGHMKSKAMQRVHSIIALLNLMSLMMTSYQYNSQTYFKIKKALEIER